MKVNVYAHFHIIQAAAPLLAPGSTIVITDSAVGLVPLRGAVAYAASKAALRSLIGGAAAELVGGGIRVNGVAPGYTYTPMIVFGGQTLGDIEALLPAVAPIGRLQQPAELAALYVTLADDEVSCVAGSIYGSHGGFLGGF